MIIKYKELNLLLCVPCQCRGWVEHYANNVTMLVPSIPLGTKYSLTAHGSHSLDNITYGPFLSLPSFPFPFPFQFFGLISQVCSLSQVLLLGEPEQNKALLKPKPWG